ncbi:hypothetical protein Ddc_18198 [Ditylenchus destructor]|nr:hypothetical protein Ddc_18198 [Ditylenchus destructor]
MVKAKIVGFLLFCLLASSAVNGNEQEVHIKGFLHVPAKLAKTVVAVVKQNGQDHPSAKMTCTAEGVNKKCAYEVTIHAAPGSKYSLGVEMNPPKFVEQTLPRELEGDHTIEKDFEYVVTDRGTSIKLHKTTQGLSKKTAAKKNRAHHRSLSIFALAMHILKFSGLTIISFLLLFDVYESFFDSDQVDPISEKREIVIHGTVRVERPTSHAHPSKIVVVIKSGVNLEYGKRELVWNGAADYKYDIRFEINKDTTEISYRLGAHLKVMVDYGRHVGIGEDNGHHASSMHDIAEAFSRKQILHIQASDPFNVQKNFEYRIDDRGGYITINDKLEPSVKKPEVHMVKKHEVIEHKPKQVPEVKQHIPVAKENHEEPDKSVEHKHIEIHGTVHLKLPEGRTKPASYYAIVRRKVGAKWADYGE